MVWLKSAHSEALVQYILFTILVVLTPFIVVTRYLQGIAHLVSHLSFTLFGITIPYVLIIAVVTLSALIIWQIKALTRRKLLALAVIAALIFIAHQTMDIYLEMSFFDLQQNWHYFAYGTYVFFFFRAFHTRHIPKNKMIIYTYFSAIAMSLFDELFQYFMSDRVFDISDITKDGLGVFCGLILVLFVTKTYGTIKVKERSFTHLQPADYLKDPFSILIVLGLLTLSFVMVSPLLTAHGNILYCIFAGLLLFIISFLILHFSQFKRFRIAFLCFMSALVILLAGSFVLNVHKNIVYNRYALTIYKGIPIPFFDFLIYPNGYFHLVDKKHFFNNRDVDFFLERKPDILLIGSGSQGKGGKGFDVDIGTYFIFNSFTMKGTQVIILPTPEACEKYNALKQAGKSVLFVVHNTC